MRFEVEHSIPYGSIWLRVVDGSNRIELIQAGIDDDI